MLQNVILYTTFSIKKDYLQCWCAKNVYIVHDCNIGAENMDTVFVEDINIKKNGAIQTFECVGE